jgi:hypothetical protein
MQMKKCRNRYVAEHPALGVHRVGGPIDVEAGGQSAI